jgi:RHS repeat-associated protein
MCPGLAVLGGGGGGGDGDGDGNGGKGGSGGDGKGSGKGAGGDGKGADGCGGGSSGGCAQCSHSVSAGHPVDVVTGRAFTNPACDLYLPGPIPLELVRIHSSSAVDRDLGLGFGWSHTFSWRVEVHRRHLRLLTDDGRHVDFALLDVGASATSRAGWTLTREEDGYVLDTNRGLARRFAVADARGRTWLLTAVRDLHDNQITLTYTDGALVEILDSAGRIVRVQTTPQGRIASIAVRNAASQGRWITFATYGYDREGDLVGARGPDGESWAYAYQDHKLTRETDANGLTFHFVYDSRDRCIETWGDYPGRLDPSLSPRVPALLADGTTRAKGIFHVRIDFSNDGYSEVADSVRVRRFFGNADGTVDKAVDGGGVTSRIHDEWGNPLREEDPMGAVTTYAWDRRGRLLAITDALERTRRFRYDDGGHLVSAIDAAGGEWEIDRDRRGDAVRVRNPRGATSSYRFDDRGYWLEETLPNGGKRHFKRDAQGNLVEYTDAASGVWRFVYDYLGRCLSRTDPLGGVLTVAHTDGGRPVLSRDALGGVTRYTWDGVGNLVEIVDVDGAVLRFEYGGFRVRVATRYPNGDVARTLYDREGRMIDEINERGEVHERTLDARGNCLEEKTFDGRRVRFTYDLAGRRIKAISASHEITTWVYDAAGDLVERTLPDGAVETFAYDARGDLAGLNGPDYAVVFERDEVGNVVREEQTFRGDKHAVESAYDLRDARTGRSTSLGHVLGLALDPESRRVRAELDRGDVVVSKPDGLGRDVRRELPRGGAIEESYDAMGQLLGVRSSTTVGALGPGEPDWLGPRGVTSERAYTYGASGEVSTRWDLGKGVTTYGYDARHRLESVIQDGAAPQLFSHDETSNLHERGPGSPPRAYGAGNRLLTRGGTSYRWDDDGRLVEKRVAREGATELWGYEWDGRGYLAAVARPDGSRVEFSYDALGRRLCKELKRADRAIETVRFVWDGGTIVHEIREKAAASGDPIVEERTYCIDGGDTPMPIAHRDGQGPWRYYVNDLTGAPEHLVDGAGVVVGQIERSAWGESRAEGTTTPLRFAGQYEDEETGLCYNRHRYYDPEVGRYLSPDPIGLDGDINAYRYSKNPITSVDPLGLIWDGTKWVNTAAATWQPKGSSNARPFPDPAGRQWANDPGGRHSEGRILDELKKKPKKDLEGSTLAISGDFHSCAGCKKELAAFAKKNKMTIHYMGNHDINRPRETKDPRLFTAGPSGVINKG